MEPFRNRPASSERPHEYSCPSCGTKFLAKSARCPKCHNNGDKGDEVLKKITDDNDLFKAS